MSLRFATILVVCAFAVSAVAQDKVCSSSADSNVSQSSGVLVRRITLSGKWGSNPATIFQPDADLAQAAIVFSHSEIQQDGRPAVDLLPLAFTLAQAGAAVIVPERALHWPPTTREMNREGAVVLTPITSIAASGKPRS